MAEAASKPSVLSRSGRPTATPSERRQLRNPLCRTRREGEAYRKIGGFLKQVDLPFLSGAGLVPFHMDGLKANRMAVEPQVISTHGAAALMGAPRSSAR